MHGERACGVTEGFLEEVAYAESCWMHRRQPDEGAGDACVLGRKNKKRGELKALRKAGAWRRALGMWIEREAETDPQGSGSH